MGARLVGAVAALAVGLSGCGGDDEPELRDAARKSLAGPGASFVVTGQLRQDGRRLRVRGSGRVLFGTDRSTSVVRVGTRAIDDSAPGGVETVITPDRTYARRNAERPGRFVPRRTGPAIERALGTISADPIRLLRAALSTTGRVDDGAQRSLGRPTRRYTTTIDLDGDSTAAEVDIGEDGRIAAIAVTTIDARVRITLTYGRQRAIAVP